MRLTWRDAMATAFVAAAAVLYGLWTTGTALTGTSTRMMATTVFALGFLGCTSDAKRMAEAYAPGAEHRPSMPFIVTATLVGVVALVSGIVAIVAATEAPIVVMLGAMLLLWVFATGRHLLVPTSRHDDHRVGATARVM